MKCRLVAMAVFVGALACGAASGQVFVDRLIPVVTQVTGATLYRTSVTISNASDTDSSSIHLQFSYRSPVDGTFQVVPINIQTPLGPHQVGFLVDVVQALKDAGAIRAADVNAALFGTLLVTFNGISFFDRAHTAAVARTYSEAAGGGTNGIAYAGRCECESGSQGRVQGAGRSGAFLTDGNTRANLGIVNEGPGATDVTVTYFNGVTGQQLKQFPLSSVAGHVLEENEVYQINNVFTDPAIPANVPALVVRIEAVADGPYVSAYVVQLDNTSQDGSFFLLEEE
jgi:hypothetical protein